MSSPLTAGYVDPRGPRFGAWLTTAVLVAVLLTQATWLIAAQTAVFAIGAVFGLSKAPYGLLFRTLVRPRLGAATELELAAPPRFAQAVGSVFGLCSTIGFAAGSSAIGLVFAGFALVAALLNAAFGICLGCEVYLLFRRSGAARFISPQHVKAVSA